MLKAHFKLPMFSTQKGIPGQTLQSKPFSRKMAFMIKSTYRYNEKQHDTKLVFYKTKQVRTVIRLSN